MCLKLVILCECDGYRIEDSENSHLISFIESANFVF